MILKALFKFTFFGLFFPVFLNTAFAQNTPPGQEPGAQVERYKKDVEQEKQRLEYKQRKAPEIKIEEEKPKPVTEGAWFTLKEIRVTGATIFSPQDFVPLYQPFLEKKVTFADIESIIEKIKARYKAKGYLTTTVYLPEQDVKEGKIEIRVAEGKMGKLRIEGNKWFSTALIEKFFHVKKNEILNIKSLQRDILRLNKNSDLEVKTVISAGEEPQTSDLTLQIKDKFPWHIGFSQDNKGTRLVGKYRSALSLRSSNVSGLGDTIFINTLYSGRAFGESVSYTIPVGTYGTKFGIDTTYFKMKLGKEYKSFDITGSTQIYTPYFSWELALCEDFEANANLGLDIKSIKKKTGDNVTSSDQMRLPYFGIDLFHTNSFGGQTNFSPKFTFGTEHFLGASKRNHPTASRDNTGGRFFKYEQSLGYTQRIPWETYLSVRSQFQIASRTLASSEQFQLGGANSVRGYPEGDYLADFGGSLNLDWVFPLYFIPREWKLAYSDTALRYQIEPVLFADVGGGKLKKVLPGERHDKFLVGIGGGLRAHLYNKIYLRLEWATHVGDKPTGNSGPSTFHLTFQSEI